MPREEHKLNKDKFKLKCTEAPYIGHLLTTEGLRPDPGKVEAITKMEKPKDVHGVQRIIGMTNYLAKFLSELSDICEPLRKLTRKDMEWHWTDIHDDAYNTIKSAVTKAPVLKYFNSKDETTVQCDASDTGLGATLMQKGEPVAFCEPRTYGDRAPVRTDRKGTPCHSLRS